MKKIGNWLSNIILVLAIALLAFVLAVPLAFAGRVAVVLSGSMEPNMPMGALAITLPIAPEKIEVGDIIALAPPWDPDVTVSHRVVEIRNGEELAFSTKGDANEDVDPWYMPAEYVRGRVVFDIPYAGYLVNTALNYVKTWTGLALLVVLPSLIIVGGTIRGIAQPPSRRQKQLELLHKRRQRHKR